jgi:hypothetical protein
MQRDEWVAAEAARHWFHHRCCRERRTATDKNRCETAPAVWQSTRDAGAPTRAKMRSRLMAVILLPMVAMKPTKERARRMQRRPEPTRWTDWRAAATTPGATAGEMIFEKMTTK